MDLHDAGPLLILSIVIVVGLLFGAGARRLRLPGITGQILAGVLMGQAGFDFFGTGDHSPGEAGGDNGDPLHALAPLTHFALGLMAVMIGAHLNLRRLRNAGKRLFYLLVFEATITPAIVFGAFYAYGVEPGVAILFCTVAIATAPATVVAVVREARAKGVFVKTLIAAVALNNMACIFLFEIARMIAHVEGGLDADFTDVLLEPSREFLLAVGIGGTVAIAMEAAVRSVVRKEHLATAAVVGLVFTSGTATFMDASPLLACLFLGLVQTNISRTSGTLVDSVFEDFLPAILAVFFTLAGMHLSLEHAATAGVLSLILFVARGIGKYLSADLAMRFAHATDRVRKNLGPALLPQAGVAVALVLLVQEDPALAEIAPLFSAVVLTVVTVNEIVGPICLRMSLKRSGEAGMDRMRLIDFLNEEEIQTDFEASSVQDAIEKLVDFLLTTHHLDIDRDAFLASVLNREAQASTCLGSGLAVPHGILPEGHKMAGVMALSRSGLAFPTPDERPVHCIVLLGTSPEERNRHLQVLAALAQTIGLDTAFQTQLFNAKSPAHASELLHGEESVGFNYFLGDEEE